MIVAFTVYFVVDVIEKGHTTSLVRDHLVRLEWGGWAPNQSKRIFGDERNRTKESPDSSLHVIRMLSLFNGFVTIPI